MSDLGNKAVLAKNLKRLMDDAGVDRNQLCTALGFRYSTVSEWLNGTAYPRIDKIEKMARYFGVMKSALVEEQFLPANIVPMPSMKNVPLVGTIACGEPILAEQNIEGNVTMPDHVHADFCLRCKGDSMTGARINDGDLVFIRQQPTVDDGQIAAVLIGDEATLKRVYHQGEMLVLSAENPAYKPMICTPDQEIRVLGLAVAFISPVA